MTTIQIWSAGQPARLLASRNRRNGQWRFPPVPEGSPSFAEWEVLPLRAEGVVYSVTTIHPNPKSGLAPYSLGYVDLEGPIRLFGRIDGPVAAIGAACGVAFDAEFGYRFVAPGAAPEMGER